MRVHSICALLYRVLPVVASTVQPENCIYWTETRQNEVSAEVSPTISKIGYPLLQSHDMTETTFKRCTVNEVIFAGENQGSH